MDEHFLYMAVCTYASDVMTLHAHMCPAIPRA